MEEAKKKMLEEAGWKVGSAEEFLGEVYNTSSFAEEEIADLKLIQTITNHWMCKNIWLYQHPSIECHVIAVEVWFDKHLKRIVELGKGLYSRELFADDEHVVVTLGAEDKQ